MLVYARLRYVATSEWGSKRYLSTKHLESQMIQQEENTKVTAL